MNLISGVALVLQLACFGLFIKAASGFFKVQDKGSAKGKKIISAMGLPTMLSHSYFLFTGSPNEVQIAVGILLFLLSFSLVFVTLKQSREREFSFAFAESKPNTLFTNGTYQLARHPFYLGYSLCWLGGCVWNPHPLVVATAAMMIGLYIYAAAREERQILASSLGAQYRAYSERVGMFYPKPHLRKQKSS